MSRFANLAGKAAQKPETPKATATTSPAIAPSRVGRRPYPDIFHLHSRWRSTTAPANMNSACKHLWPKHSTMCCGNMAEAQLEGNTMTLKKNDIADYLTAAIKDGNATAFPHALGNAVLAFGWQI